MDKKVWEWRRTVDSQEFVISTARELLPLAFVQECFADDAMFWARPLTDEATRAMLDTSCTLGLYKIEKGDEHKPIGMARMVTDYTTLAYLTDVFLRPEYRGLGLGTWLIHSSRDISMEIPDLRWLVLLTGSDQAQQLYRRELGMHLIDGQEDALSCMGARRIKLAEAAGTPLLPRTSNSGASATHGTQCGW